MHCPGTFSTCLKHEHRFLARILARLNFRRRNQQKPCNITQRVLKQVKWDCLLFFFQRWRNRTDNEDLVKTSHMMLWHNTVDYIKKNIDEFNDFSWRDHLTWWFFFECSSTFLGRDYFWSTPQCLVLSRRHSLIFLKITIRTHMWCFSANMRH